jgi:hypothetical protein
VQTSSLSGSILENRSNVLKQEPVETGDAKTAIESDSKAKHVPGLSKKSSGSNTVAGLHCARPE